MSVRTSPWNTSGPARSLGDGQRPGAPGRERTDESPQLAWERLVGAGLHDVLVAPEAGGGGGSVTVAAGDVADVAAGDLVGALILAGHHAGIAALRAGGPATAAIQEGIRRDGRRLSPAVATTSALTITPREGGHGLRGTAAPVHGANAAQGFVAIARNGDGVPWVVAVPAERPGSVVDDLSQRAGLRRLPAGSVQFLDTPTQADEAVALADGAPSPEALNRGLQALFAAAAAVGAARGSVDAAASLTRERPRPRPVPGATSAITDPIGQVVIGGAFGPIEAAHALVLEVADEFAAALDGPGAPVGTDALPARALAALDTALEVALNQGEQVFEIVGTSGSGNAHGFDALWRDIRTLSLLWPRAERRRAIGRAHLEVIR